MSYFNVFSIGLFCPNKLAHLEMSYKSVVNVKTPAECLEYLKHITIKLISVGMEPPIGVVTHPPPDNGRAARRKCRVVPGSPGYYSVIDPYKVQA